jgi:hypothetical protein
MGEYVCVPKAAVDAARHPSEGGVRDWSAGDASATCMTTVPNMFVTNKFVTNIAWVACARGDAVDEGVESPAERLYKVTQHRPTHADGC